MTPQATAPERGSALASAGEGTCDADPPSVRAGVEPLLLWILVALTLLCFTGAVASRLFYPLALDTAESGALRQALEIAAGRSAYPPPSADFIPQPQTPGYSLWLALWSWIIPIKLATARGWSLVWIGAALFALWRIVLREGRDHQRAMLAIALFVSGYAFAGQSLDLATADAQFLALGLWALKLLRGAWGHRLKAVGAGLLMTAAYWSHPEALWLILASGVAALAACPKQLPVYLGTLFCGVGLGTAFYIFWTEGYFWRYLFSWATSADLHQLRWSSIRQGFWLYSLQTWPALSALVGILVYDISAPWWSRQRKLGAREDERLLARWSAYRGYAYWLSLSAFLILGSGIRFAASGASYALLLMTVALMAVAVTVVLPERGGRAQVGLRLLGLQLLYLLVFQPDIEASRRVRREGVGWTMKVRGWDLGIPAPASWARARAQKERWLQLGQEGLLDRYGALHRGPVLALHDPLWNHWSGGKGHPSSLAMRGLAKKTRAEVEAQLEERLLQGEYAALWIADPATQGAPTRARGGLPDRLRRALSYNYRLVEVEAKGKEPGDSASSDLTSVGGKMYLRASAIALPPGCRRLVDFEDATAQGVEVSGIDMRRNPLRAGRLGRPAGAGEEDAMERAPEFVGVGGHYYFATVAPHGPPLRATGRVQLGFRSEARTSRLRIHCGFGGEASRLRVRLYSPSRSQAIDIDCADGKNEMRGIWVSDIGPSPDWKLEFVDESPRGFLAFDEIWLCDEVVD